MEWRRQDCKRNRYPFQSAAGESKARTDLCSTYCPVLSELLISCGRLGRGVMRRRNWVIVRKEGRAQVGLTCVKFIAWGWKVFWARTAPKRLLHEMVCSLESGMWKSRYSIIGVL